MIPALMLLVVLRKKGPESTEHAAIEGSAARALWDMAPIRYLCGLVFVGFGIFVALATWLQTLLQPAGVSEAEAGGLLVGMVIAGLDRLRVHPPPGSRAAAPSAASCRAPWWSHASDAWCWAWPPGWVRRLSR